MFLKNTGIDYSDFSSSQEVEQFRKGKLISAFCRLKHQNTPKMAPTVRVKTKINFKDLEKRTISLWKTEAKIFETQYRKK